MKIVINSQYGGFGLSHDAVLEYARLKFLPISATNIDISGYNEYVYTLSVNGEQYPFNPETDIERDDQALVNIVERMGEKANGKFCTLKVIELPNNIKWFIEERGGKEWIAEEHRIWE